MEMVCGNSRRLVIRIKKTEEKIRLATVFAFLLVVCLPFHTLTIGGVGLLMLVGLPLVVLRIPRLLSYIRNPRWDLPTLLLVAFLIYNIAAYILTPYFSAYSAYNYIKIAAIVVCFYCQEYNRREKKLLLTGSMLSCLIICFFLLTGTGTGYYSDRTTIAVFGVIQDPNYLGYLYLIPMAVSIEGFLKQKRLAFKFVYALIVFLILLCVMTGGSRAAFLGIAVVAVVCVIRRFKRMSTRIIFCIFMALVAVAAYGVVLTLLPEHIAARFSVQEVINSRGTNRLDIWIDALQTMAASPYGLLFGFGAGCSQYLLGGWATHNLILQLLLEDGIVCTTLFVAFVWIWIKKLIRQDTMCLSVVLGCMVMALTLSVNTIHYFWVVFILALVCSEKRRI